MSSIGSSDSGRDDSIRRNREDYRQKESDLVKKYQREIRNINESHASEVENLKESHAKQIEDMQQNAREVVTERDQRNQGDIENLRQLHRKQLQQNADDANKKDASYRDAFRNERNSNRSIKDQKIEHLQKDNQIAARKVNTDYSKGLAENREEQMRGIASQREKLEKAHQTEIESLRENRDKRIAELQKDYARFRKDSSEGRREQEVRHMADTERQSDNLLRTVKKERENNAEALRNMSGDYGGSLGDIRETYEKNLQKEHDKLETARQNLEDDVRGRAGARINELETSNQDLKEGNIHDNIQANRTKNREVANVRDAMQRNVDNYKAQKDDAVRLGNEKRTKDLNQLSAKDSKELQDTHRYYREKMDDSSRAMRDEYRNINEDFAGRGDQLQKMADLRVKNIHDESEESKSRLLQSQEDNHKTQQRQHSEKLKFVRSTTEQQKNEAIERIKEISRKNDVAHSEKLQEVQSHYEKEVLDLQDQLMREKKGNEEQLHKTVDNMERAHQKEMDQQTAKYESRMRSMQTAQSDELKRVARANEERMNQVLANRKT